MHLRLRRLDRVRLPARRHVGWLALTVALAAALPAVAQQPTAMDGVFLAELGAMVAAEEGALRVVFVDPDNGGEGVLAEGDEVRMIDGQRLVDLAALRAAYQAAAVGSEVKLAVVRGERPFLARFTRQAGGGHAPMIRRLPMQLDFDRDAYAETRPLAEIGAIVGVREGAVEIAALLPFRGEDTGESDDEKSLAAGDVVVALDGQPVADLADLVARLAALEVGAGFRLTVRRGDEERGEERGEELQVELVKSNRRVVVAGE